MPTRPPGFFQLVKRAFNARPFGMIVPPNWIGIGAMGLLGLVNPGFWVLGAGLKLGYLMLLGSSDRFRRTVSSSDVASASGDWNARVARALAELSPADRKRYDAIAERWQSILDLQSAGAASPPVGIDAQQEGLGRLSWMYLRLLLARHTISKVLGAAGGGADGLERSVAALKRRLQTEQLADDLRHSLEGQLEILRQRVTHHGDADRQLSYIDAELSRIEHQFELIREQAALSTDPIQLSQRIDEIAATLGGTSQWIRDQRQAFGAMEDLLTEPAPPPIASRAKESQ